MAKRLLVLALLAAAWATAGAGAQTFGTPDAYRMTFNQFQLCKNANFTDCTPPLGAPQSFDIDTVQPGDTIGTFDPFTDVEPGLYVSAIVTISRTIVITGSVANVPRGAACGGGTVTCRTVTGTATANTPGPDRHLGRICVLRHPVDQCVLDYWLQDHGRYQGPSGVTGHINLNRKAALKSEALDV